MGIWEKMGEGRRGKEEGRTISLFVYCDGIFFRLGMFSLFLMKECG